VTVSLQLGSHEHLATIAKEYFKNISKNGKKMIAPKGGHVIILLRLG